MSLLEEAKASVALAFSKRNLVDEHEFYWHIHHSEICEPLIESLDKRISYIVRHKAESEINLRLVLIRPVRGKLPMSLVSAGLRYKQSIELCNQTSCFYQGWLTKAVISADEENVKAHRYFAEELETHSVYLEELHASECQGPMSLEKCPWDGHNIFTRTKTVEMFY